MYKITVTIGRKTLEYFTKKYVRDGNVLQFEDSNGKLIVSCNSWHIEKVS